MMTLKDSSAGYRSQDDGWKIIPAAAIVPAGEFVMGQTADDKFANDTERPAHVVKIATAFGLGYYPLTVREYREFDPAHTPLDDPSWPVVGVSWHDAQAYCAWLGGQTGKRYRLPSEAEWEYACRAGTTTAFSGGSTLEPVNANYLYDEHGTRIGHGQRTPVGRYLANAFGLFDLHGNVCEWTTDTWHPHYAGAPSEGSPWIDPAESRRVIRGGAWDYLPRLLRSSWRDGLAVDQARDNVGFRIAHDL